MELVATNVVASRPPAPPTARANKTNLDMTIRPMDVLRNSCYYEADCTGILLRILHPKYSVENEFKSKALRKHITVKPSQQFERFLKIASADRPSTTQLVPALLCTIL